MKTGRLSGWRRVSFGVVLYLPLAWITYRYVTGSTFYGEYLHLSGQWAVYLLLLVLAFTPLRRIFASARLPRWFLSQRRDVGIAVFIYAFAHTIAYVLYLDDLHRVVKEGLQLAILTGWIAGLVFLVLAVTSNDVSVAGMGWRWRALHKTMYLAALLTAVHWVLTAFDPTVGYIVLVFTIVLLGLRLRLRMN